MVLVGVSEIQSIGWVYKVQISSTRKAGQVQWMIVT